MIKEALKTIRANLEGDARKTLLSLGQSYYIILTVDLTKEQKSKINWDVLHGWNHRKVLKITEKESDYPGDYHRKLVGMLDQEQFDKLVDDFRLVAQPIETMGSLTELGHLPAIWFTDYGEFGSDAYVTPFLPCQMDPTEGDEQPMLFGEGMSEKMKEELLDKLWEAQNKLVIEVYGE